MSIERGLGRGIERDARVDYDILPTAIFEELEDCKAKLKAIEDDQVLQEVRVSRKYQEGAQEPAVTQDTLLDISRTSAVLYKRCLVRGNFMRSLPINLGAVLRVLWWVRWVLV